MSAMALFCPVGLAGRARQLCPSISDVDFLCDFQRVVDLDTKIANGAFNPRVPEKELSRTQVIGATID
jgi:hypothetical protein